MPEQLVLQNLFGQSGAVEGEERPPHTLTFLMNRARDQLLTRARLAEDENTRIRVRHGVDHLIDAAHRLGLARELTVMREPFESRCQLAILLQERELVEQLRDLRLELVEALCV